MPVLLSTCNYITAHCIWYYSHLIYDALIKRIVINNLVISRIVTYAVCDYSIDPCYFHNAVDPGYNLFNVSNIIITHCGLVMSYGNKYMGQHWLRWWLVAWRHQVFTWITVDLSLIKSPDIHLRAISQETPQPSITKIPLKITYLKLH